MLKLKIYSDPDYLPQREKHLEMLYPFWGACPEPPELQGMNRFDNYMQIAPSLFEMVASPTDADLAIMPTDWKRYVRQNQEGLAIEFAKRMDAAGKRVAVFLALSHSKEEIPIANGVFFRTSLYRSTKKPNVYALPSWSVDFVTRFLDGKLLIRQKKSKPTVGFCGYSERENVSLFVKLKKVLRDFSRRKEMHNGLDRFNPSRLRGRVLGYLSNDPVVQTNFIIRDGYFGGSVSHGRWDMEQMKRVRREYLENMLDTDYNVCIRGGANTSIRLYETLSCGRIPVFIDTDCVLPYSSQIDWKKYCVWVDESEIPQVAEKVADFHSRISPQDFVAMQHESRKLWEQWLSPEGFFANFYQHFETLITFGASWLG